MNIAGKYRNKNAVSISARRITRYYTPTISRYHVIFLLGDPFVVIDTWGAEMQSE